MLLRALFALALLLIPAVGWAQQKPTPAFNAPANTLAVLGDSWAAQIYSDSTTTQLALESINFINQANAQLGRRIRIVADYGVSGQRSDEYLYRLPQLLASGAKWAWVRGVVNDLAGAGGFQATAAQVWNGYTNTNRGNNQSSIGLKAAYDQILASGMGLILTSEPGQTGWSAAQIAQRDIFNQYQRDYALSHAGQVQYIDINQYILTPAGASIAFNTGYSGDGTHLMTLGAQKLGVAIAPIFANIFPAVDYPVSTQTEIAAGGNLITNSLFTTTTGGTTGSGVTGTTAANWYTICSGSATATTSVVSDTAGFGNDQQLVITATTAGDQCKIYYYFNPSTASTYVGQNVVFGATINVATGSSNLCTPYVQNLFQHDSITTQSYDQFSGITGSASTVGACANIGVASSAFGPGLTTAYTLVERTPAFTIPSFTTGNQWYAYCVFTFAGAGSATVTVGRAYYRLTNILQ
jgi:hypothetical protein